MTSDQITGILRIVLPVLISLFGGTILPDTTVTSITTVAATVLAAIWSAFAHTTTATVATVAALPTTKVSADGKTITLLDPKLIAASKAAAT